MAVTRLEEIGRQLDEWIEDDLREYEARIRRDLAATGPEDEDALDRVPDPDSPWLRVTVEEVVILRRDQLIQWRRQVLAYLHDRLLGR